MEGERTNMDERTVRILVVDDELPIRRFLRASLSGQYTVLEAATGQEALAVTVSGRPDAIILDLGLPDLDGTEVTRQLREWTQIPVIVISGREREEDKIAALDAGADDFLTKPFGIGELLARIRVATRHAQRSGEAEDPVFELGRWRVDLAKREVRVEGVEVHLTPNEYKLLTTLIRHAGKVLTHHMLLKEVWGSSAGAQPHYLRVYMAQLRQKLEEDSARPKYLITEPGVGYRLRLE